MMRRCSSQPHSPESHKVCPKRCVERKDWGNAKVMRSIGEQLLREKAPYLLRLIE